ncbi:L,D-transpeptidase family protein [Streptomyces sp. Go40/10]|uniref:L,D-transpeptidase family protein n=1 Tax=Streptomyces sp. Go40/10 TaxID=2825844 RepID=UPI001E356BE8|nr:L,D-transpeptidase family protein [Streptomyces sp. Go40/10]UFR06008.1 L,D-transpeptidase family protein [Streptomyces sp. Go40/10]
MQIDSVRRRTVAGVAALGALLATLSACGTPAPAPAHGARGAERSTTVPSAPTADPTRIPGVGDRLYRRIPAGSRQVVAVYGKGRNSADSLVVLYARQGAHWRRMASWPAHNGRRGWTAHHHEGDARSPVGVFTLTDAGGVLADPGTRLPYDQNEGAYAPPAEWDEAHQHDFDYVIAIDYNRVKGTPPRDATRPWGTEKGGGIWLHLDHGSGTSACVSVSRKAMEFLLRTLDPARDPVVVMGDRTSLRA